MRRYAWIALAVLLSLPLVGCKKEQAKAVRTPVPTATPVPDKDLLGFTRGGAIWVMRYDGAEQRLLARPGRGQSFWFPMPSPAGDHLIAWMSRADGTQDIVRVDLSGRVTVLTEIGAKARSLMKNVRLGNAPAYSPDGKRIAYGFNGEIWLMDASGYNAETFIADGASWAPSFSPDGKRLVYVNGSDGRFDVWMADIDSRDTWQVTDYSDFTAGQPRWSKDGLSLILTRSQGEDSDVILVNLPKDSGSKGGDLSAPLTEAEPMTKDRLSSAAVWDPSGTHLLFSSARENGLSWNLYSADSLGGNAKQLTHDGAYSPFWMRPGSMTAAVLDLAPSRPTPVVAQAVVAAAPTAIPTAIPPTPVPSKPAATLAPGPATVATKPTAVATGPGTAKVLTPAPAKPGAAAPTAVPSAAKPGGAPQASAAPTQPPVKAAPLRLRLRASFNNDASLAPAGLAELKKLSPRVAQYAGEAVTIIGPLDRSPLKGKFADEAARSLARAKAIATELTKEAKLKAGVAKAQPYAPPAAGASGPPNSIQVYVELK
jgi:hypothetical protein